jgi:hypothetical protein
VLQAVSGDSHARLAGNGIYLTTIPELTFDAAHRLTRSRWQIELLFKLWKSPAGWLRSRSADPIRQPVEGSATRLGLLIAHWTLLVAAGQPDTLGTVLLREHVPLVRRALSGTSLFAQALS